MGWQHAPGLFTDKRKPKQHATPEIGAANPGVATKRGGASVCSHT